AVERLMSLTTTAAPDSASPRAIARPKPEPAPVTYPRLPERSKSICPAIVFPFFTGFSASTDCKNMLSAAIHCSCAFRKNKRGKRKSRKRESVMSVFHQQPDSRWIITILLIACLSFSFQLQAQESDTSEAPLTNLRTVTVAQDSTQTDASTRLQEVTV